MVFQTMEESSQIVTAVIAILIWISCSVSTGKAALQGQIPVGYVCMVYMKTF